MAPRPIHTQTTQVTNAAQPQWDQLIQDYEAGIHAVVLSTRERVSEPSGQTYDPRFGLRRSIYDRSTGVLTLELLEGRRLEVEVGREPDSALAGRVRVYLDQNNGSPSRSIYTPPPSSPRPRTRLRQP